MTDDEEKVIGILTSWMPTYDNLSEPIHAVDRAMGWDTDFSLAFVDALLRRGLINSKAQLGLLGEPPLWWWERPANADFDEFKRRGMM